MTVICQQWTFKKKHFCREGRKKREEKQNQSLLIACAARNDRKHKIFFCVLCVLRGKMLLKFLTSVKTQ